MTTVPVRRLAWLDREIRAWQVDGLITGDEARAIQARYVASRRGSLTRLLLALGACFTVAGLVWLVATNLDRLSPSVRFAAVTALWLGLVAGAELLADRLGSDHAAPVVGAARGLAAGAFGAVVLQAAQSLQVSAHTAALIGWWGLGALLYAYAVDGVTPLLVGVVATAVWFDWQSAVSAEGMLGFVGAVLLGSVVATAVAVLHGARGRAAFAPIWRVAAAVLALIGLFAAALPRGTSDRTGWSTELTVGAVVAGVAAGAAAFWGRALDRAEAAVPVAAVLVGVALVLWRTPQPVSGPDVAVTARAIVAVLAYLALAGWYAVLGVRRDLPALTGWATAALVVFTTVQSFAVFAPIVSGAALFLVVGVVLLASGYGFDRARRRLVARERS